jgi:hypothetical protein
VFDGEASASLAPFAIVVTAVTATASATLTWDAPEANTNGSPLTDLADYTIYYGTTSVRSPKSPSDEMRPGVAGIPTV